MTLRTRSIQAPKKDSDGVRILVMRPRRNGEMPDVSITPEMFDQWWKELGPPSKLIGAYYRKEISWDEYAEKFRAYLELPHIEELLLDLIARTYREDITILCMEETPERCHRRFIAERCKELDNVLDVIIE